MNIPTDFLMPTDFEEFANRVSEVLFNKKIFGFGEGKDDGIDGIDDTISPTIVIQSKRYQSRTNPSDLVKIVFKEIDKIKETALKYKWTENFEYVIITSANLNPTSRKKIRDYAGKLMSSDNNIIDGIVLKQLSYKEEYEKIFIDYNLKNKKLVELLREGKQECISIESRAYFSDFNSKYFVETKVLYSLFDLLDKERIAILIGDPGVGKTTMCKMIGNLFSSKSDSDYVILERNIDEIQNVIEMYNSCFKNEKTKKLFVVFDDFLGRTSLDTSERQIKKLRTLYSLVSNSDNLYILLNSRTQILNAARNEDIEFGQLIDDKNNKKVTIDISKYSPVEKAYIFRKNIEFEFDQQSIEEKNIMRVKYNDLLENRKYRSIVSHRNFNPRLISLIASQSIKSNGNYFEYCRESLNNPSQIYDGLFNKMSMECKFFLINLYCFEEYPVPVEKAEKSFKYLMINENYDLNEIEKALEESWIVTKNDETLKNECFDFINPSIVDFLSSKKNSSSMLNRIPSQTRYLAQIKKSSGVDILYEKVGNNYNFYFDRCLYAGERISCLLQKNEITEHDEFIKFLYDFSGKYHKRSSVGQPKSDWGELVSEFYFSNNVVAKRIFMEELFFSKTNSVLIDNILDNILDVDSFSKVLDYLVEEVYGCSLSQNELIDSAEEQTGVNLYDTIIYCKQQILQDKIDDLYEIDNFLESISYAYTGLEEDKLFIVHKIIEDYQDNIYQEVEGTFFESEVENFDLDFSVPDSYIREKIDEYLQDLNSYEEDYKPTKFNELETVDTVLNKPL